MSRTPKPRHLHVVDGTRADRADHPRGSEPVPGEPLGPSPAGLTAREKEVWRLVCRELPPGMLRRVDQFVLVAFCRAVALADEAAEKLRATALVIKTPNGGVQQSPFLGIINRQAVIIKTLGTELGLSPAARTRISLGDEAVDDDPTAKYFAG